MKKNRKNKPVQEGRFVLFMSYKAIVFIILRFISFIAFTVVTA
nr:hypothetical protein [uncultured Bacillus sp.]